MPSGVFKRSDEHRANIKKALTGMKRTPEQCKRISEAQKGKPKKPPNWTPERREEVMRNRAAGRKRGKDHHFFGKGASPEARKIISATHKGISYKVCRQNGISPEAYRSEIAAGNKWCGPCKKFVPADQIVRASVCKVCAPIVQRASMLRRSFGVDAVWYEQKLASQGGACAICRSPEKLSRNGFLAIDHDHDTGAIRGLLCIGCNAMLGRIESPAFVPCMKYLAEHSSKTSRLVVMVEGIPGSDGIV